MCPILQLDCQMCNSWMCTEEATCICIKVCTWIWRESWLWMEIWHWTETWLEHLDCEQECWVTSTNWYLQKRFEQCWGHLDWRPWKGGATLWVHDFSTKCYCSTLQILCAQKFFIHTRRFISLLTLEIRSCILLYNELVIQSLSASISTISTDSGWTHDWCRW